MDKSYFRRLWGSRMAFNWQLGVFLILLFGIPRFIMVLAANSSGDYTGISFIFIAMCATPFFLLNRTGRQRIGLRKPGNGSWWAYALLLGMGACLVVHVTGTSLFGSSTDNWFVYISKSYAGSIPMDFQTHRFQVFSMLAAIGITFSPLGEELLYRGLIHECFVPSLGENKASMIDSTAFAITHLAHFGILYDAGSWTFRFIPALLWVLLMYMSSRLFFYAKQKGGSLYMAVLSHAGFNLSMTYFICYHIL